MHISKIAHSAISNFNIILLKCKGNSVKYVFGPSFWGKEEDKRALSNIVLVATAGAGAQASADQYGHDVSVYHVNDCVVYKCTVSIYLD